MLGWPLGPQEGLKFVLRAQRGKSTLYPETDCIIPSNLVGLIPRGLEPEVVKMGHMAPGGPRGRAPRGDKQSFLLVQIQYERKGTLYVLGTFILILNDIYFFLFMTRPWIAPFGLAY